MALDPATAVFNAIAAGFNFFSTPAGQGVVQDWRELFKELMSLGKEIVAAQKPGPPKPGPANP